MALDHSRLGLETKSLENKSGRFFLRSTSLLYKNPGLTNLGACKLTYYTFYTSHLRWNSTIRHCFYHTALGQHYFTILKHKLHSFNIQDDRSTRGLLAKPLKKISIQNHLYGQPAASCGVFEWTLIELPFNIIKNLTCLFFIQWFYNNVQSSKAFDTRGVLSTPASDVHERLKTNGTAIKNCKRDYWQSIKEI